MGNYHPILRQIGTQTKKNMLSSKFIIPAVKANFQDGRRRLFGNSSACYKMGNYHPILRQIRTQSKKNMLRLEVTIPEVTIKFQDDRRRHIGN
jgi:hypothetical protein